ncbi:voltage-dependent anion-selective channel 1 [Trypanosoma equiperdum]|uniref:Voltage-dependent anion-selective channel n=3 Tax=Trypanozoon TaxID=39700 RepID=Q586M2_TRYB2|nr:hypothetical protein, conserved [Trypanosoma brucei gambiense DAL972]XP_011771689.1 hypothetical protein, conserved [Trypanosoma brucei gambiense DAL972]XP_951552.1 hypothetical protein, conserved [Trypanosoma brucei brucei TREU927]XP_951553.1 hypothetical protein, conserved [Trypanosoma brucei brucei TREU927]AAX79148.1 hypothetical protein, conserved [Trypanosoma brucei]SCU68384.1 voltage-dependent anion-selective channel 1 [Trypanosoma equiperdum]AAQ15708.1 hypothetical protein, conserve|eukprot:XP_011771688.1 hypothetical protein, conserved [Trypanosoma brucei gambiense DAL972]
MFAPAKSLVLYKDYHKDAKDLLTKNYSSAQKWKLESKFKGPKDKLILNPTVTSDGAFSTDLEYTISQCGAALKGTYATSTSNVTGTVTYHYKGHKIEGVVNKNGNYEVSHEGNFQGLLSLHEKLTKKTLEVGAGTAIGPYCSVGCGALYNLGAKGNCDWTASCRYARCGYTAAVRTNKLNTYTTSITARVPKCPHRVVVGAEVVCGRGQPWTGVVGVEADCVLVKGNVLKARVNKKLEWAAVYIAKLIDNWTVAVTVDKSLKPGVLITHS